MKHVIRTAGLAMSIVAMSASIALAAPPPGATGHGDVVSVAAAVDYVSGRVHGEEVSKLAKAHGAIVSAAAKAQGAAAAAAGKAKASANAKVTGDAASEPGRLKAAAAAAAGTGAKP